METATATQEVTPKELASFNSGYNLKEGFKKSEIMIRPYVDPLVSNMGLEKYGEVLFDGTYQKQQLACVYNNNKPRFLTGLDEFAPEVKAISDRSEREAKQKQIRKTVSELEKAISYNFVDPTDADFWNKIVTVRPDNEVYFNHEDFTITLSNKPVELDTANPIDIIKISAIKNKGYSMIAPSLKAVRETFPTPKFFLDEYEETAEVKTEVKKLRNKALALLEKFMNKNTKMLLLISKNLDMESMDFKSHTPPNIIYDRLDDYINGKTIETSVKKTAQKFINVSQLNMETLFIKALIKDNMALKKIAYRTNVLYDLKTQTPMGKNIDEVFEFLKNPLNENILKQLTDAVEDHWNS